VIHLAGLPKRVSERAAGAIALGGTINVLEAARRTGAAKVVVTLPARHLYGEVPARELPVKDGRPWEPVTVRGVLARAIADLLGVYRQEHGLEFTSLAMASVYGPRQRPEQGVVAAFCTAAERGESARIEGDGRQTRDFLYVDDAVDAIVRSTERGSGLVVNIGTGIQTTVRDLHDLAAAGTGTRPETAPRRADEPGRFAVSPVRARIHLNWTPWTDVATGVAAVRSTLRPEG
jgi:UDP-glucose 4-epimerase